MEPEFGVFIAAAAGGHTAPASEHFCRKLNRLTDEAETTISICKFDMMPWVDLQTTVLSLNQLDMSLDEWPNT